MEPQFLSLAEVLEIHQDQIKRYGGSSGIRSMEMLESALGAPQTSFRGQFLHTDLQEIAAAYLFHIVMNHPFIDGNKRTGAVSSLVFLSLNGVEFVAPEDEFSEIVLRVAKSEMDKPDCAQFFKKWSQSQKDESERSH
jgi:death on curing protein